MMFLCLFCGILCDSTERPKKRRINIPPFGCNMGIYSVTAQWNSDETGGTIDYYHGSYMSTNDEESTKMMFNVTTNSYRIPDIKVQSCLDKYVFSVIASNCAGDSKVANATIRPIDSKWIYMQVLSVLTSRVHSHSFISL